MNNAQPGNAGQASDTGPDGTASEPVGNADAGSGKPRELGGREGPDPTRFGDWEKAGRCIDF